MVNNSLLERLGQRPHWFQESQFMNDGGVLQEQAAWGSFILGVKLTRGFLCVHTQDFREERNGGL
jgi:hypothetical protein